MLHSSSLNCWKLPTIDASHAVRTWLFKLRLNAQILRSMSKFVKFSLKSRNRSDLSPSIYTIRFTRVSCMLHQYISGHWLHRLKIWVSCQMVWGHSYRKNKTNNESSVDLNIYIYMSIYFFKYIYQSIYQAVRFMPSGSGQGRMRCEGHVQGRLGEG